MRFSPRVPTASSRSAFTLIELLIVIGIISVLFSITLAAVFRVQRGQEVTTTEKIVQKLDAALQQQWAAVLDQAKEEIQQGKARGTLTDTFANGQQNRGGVLYTKLKLKAEFPQSFNEVRANAGGIFGIPTRDVYRRAIGSGNDTPQNEAAALLYLALTQPRRGTSFNPDEAFGDQGVKTLPIAGQQMKVFVDIWGEPITFFRWTTDPSQPHPYPDLLLELDSAEHVPAGQLSKGYLDPVDPEGFLLQSRGYTGPAVAQAELRVGHAFNPPHNWTPFVLSAGPDNTWNTGDEIASFRLGE